jgi:hypothetical protein
MVRRARSSCSPNSMYPKCGDLCGQKGQEVISSWGQDVTPCTYLSQMGPFLHPIPPPFSKIKRLQKGRAFYLDLSKGRR